MSGPVPPSEETRLARQEVTPFADSLAASGETGRLIAARDWSGTSLGPLDAWPQSLRTALDIMLASPRPTSVMWGTERLQFYNDAYIPIAAGRHPAAIGRPVAETWAEAYAGFLGPILDRAYAGEAVTVEEQAVPLRPAPGAGLEERWFTATFKPIRDEAGRVAGVFHPLVETTGQHRAEAALRASERELQRLTDALPVLVSFIDAGQRYRQVNRLYEAWFRRPRSEVLGRSVLEVVGAAAFAAIRPRVDAALAGERVRFDEVIRYPDGMTRHVAAEFIPRRAPDGTVEGFNALVQDVTDARRAEAGLRESEARFRGVFDSRLMGFTIFDARTGRTLAINDAFLAMTGHARADFDAGRWDWRDFTLPEYLPLDEAAIAQARARGWWDPYEKEYRRRDGTRVPVRISSAPLGGEPGRVVVSVQDISAARAAAAELRESERRLQLAKQAAGIGVWDWDLATQRITWSPEMHELLGIDRATPRDRLYDAWAAALHPEDRPAAEARVEASRRTGEPFSFDARIRHGGGELRWIRAQAVTVADSDGRPVRMIGVNLDVTAQHREAARLRTRAETAEAEMEERTRERDRIFELSSDLFAVMGYDGYLKVVNPAWSRLLGFPEAEILQRPARVAVHPDDHARIAGLLASLKAGETVRGFEDRLLRRDGEPVWISWTCVPGDAQVFYAVGRDVTAERQREEALRQAQKMEAVGQLTGGIAHDFNNLLGAVIGGFDLIRRKPDDAGRVRRIAENGLAAAERGARLTGQLLAFSRAQRLELKPVVVSELVEGMRDLLGRTLGPMVRLSVELEPERLAVRSDPTQLEMAVLNLAINARDAMPGGGVLAIRTARRLVQRDADLPAGEYVELAVGDTGTGMPPEVASRAFDPFFTTKGVGRGTGLGLSQVYGIARQAGGTARIESRPGHGTRVSLLLPRTEAEPAAAAGPAQEGAVPEVAPATVLVIDDDADLRRMLATSLDTLGYRVIEAPDGPAGLAALAATGDPDLVLLDFAMPGLNGAEVADAIRAIRPALPIVFASGYADTAAIERVAGPKAPMLRKPFRVDELQAVLAEVLNGRP